VGVLPRISRCENDLWPPATIWARRTRQTSASIVPRKNGSASTVVETAASSSRFAASLNVDVIATTAMDRLRACSCNCVNPLDPSSSIRITTGHRVASSSRARSMFSASTTSTLNSSKYRPHVRLTPSLALDEGYGRVAAWLVRLPAAPAGRPSSVGTDPVPSLACVVGRINARHCTLSYGNISTVLSAMNGPVLRQELCKPRNKNRVSREKLAVLDFIFCVPVGSPKSRPNFHGGPGVFELLKRVQGQFIKRAPLRCRLRKCWRG